MPPLGFATKLTKKKTNEWDLKELGVQKTLRADIVARKLSYFGHVTRHQCLQKSIIQGRVEGKRRRGRPAASWFDDIKSITGLSITEATRVAADRTQWNSLIRTTPALCVCYVTAERE